MVAQQVMTEKKEPSPEVKRLRDAMRRITPEEKERFIRTASAATARLVMALRTRKKR